jgi:hypothetical protein
VDTAAFDALTDAELDQIDTRLREAAPGRWESFVEGRDHTSGSSFVMTQRDDIYLTGATTADQDFIAHARQDLPRLLNEVRRLRAHGQSR